MGFTFRHGDRPINGYTIQRGVGRGGFGEVYFALSDGGREVALKYLLENPQVELRGVSHCMNLKSPHLVTIFDVKRSADGEYFVIMEYIDGPSLRDMLVAEPKGLGPQKAAYFVRELARGLGYLHDRGIVHRDMKPGNVFFDDGYVKIGDYGLSKFISVSQHSAQTASVGTVHYMAPEVGSGNYQRGIDIYALGVMLYEMLLGRLPFEGSSMGEVLMKHLTAQPEIDDLPEPFGAVIRKALAKDPSDRYQTVEEMAEDLLTADDVERSLAGVDGRSLGLDVTRTLPPVDTPVQPPPYAAPVASPSGQVGQPPAPPYAAPIQRQHGADTQVCREVATGYVHYAGFWIRALSALIDLMIVGVAANLLVGEDSFPILAIIYQGILIGKWNGQTIGKKALGIKVISADGRPCSTARSFARAAAKLLNVFTFFIGYLIVSFDDRKRALHDHIASTLHIYACEEF